MNSQKYGIIFGNLAFDLRLFDNTQKTTTASLSDEMKTFYDKDLIKNTKPKLVHNQFGQKRDIPKKGGKIIEFRKFTLFPKATTPLTEGVTPSGRSLEVTKITASVNQYGDYVEMSDMLDMTAIDPILLETNKLLAQQAGETLDTITREILNAGTNVQYSDERVAARYLLVGDDSTWTNNHYFNTDCIRKAARNLRVNKAPTINGDYIGIIHPDNVYALKRDSDWKTANEYAGSKRIFDGEIGMFDGVRFIESTEAKIFHAADLSATRNLTVASVSSKTFTIQEALSSGQATALVGRKLIIKGYLYTVTAAAAGNAGAATITVSETVSGSPTNNEVIYPGESGAKGRDVYSTLVLGADAYGVTKIEGGGLRMIVKQLGSSGTSDPLDQRSTTGWKAIHTAEILQPLFMVRVETTSPYQSGAN